MNNKLVRMAVPAVTAVVGVAAALGLIAAVGSAQNAFHIADIASVPAVTVGGMIAGSATVIGLHAFDDFIGQWNGRSPIYMGSGALGLFLLAMAAGGAIGLVGAGVGLLFAPALTHTIAAASTVVAGGIAGLMCGDTLVGNDQQRGLD